MSEENANVISGAIIEQVDEGAVVLQYPINFEGRKISTIKLNLLDLTSDKQDRAADRYLKSGGCPGVLVLTPKYLALCASEVADVPYEAIAKLVGPDYVDLTQRVQNFLMS